MCDAEGCAPLSAGSGSRRVADQKPCVDQPLDEISVQIPAHRGQSFRRIADSVPVIADSF
jgi:hypothetical protein